MIVGELSCQFRKAASMKIRPDGVWRLPTRTVLIECHAMNEVREFLRQNEARFVDELCAYIRFPSISAQSQHHRDMESCAAWLAQHCTELGLRARVCPTAGHPVVLAQWRRAGCAGGKRRHYLIYGHYDVQPPEPYELWDSPPFQPRISGRLLFGRGSSDNKGQHFAHLKALEACLKTGQEPPAT
jgi:acetylornithine deacetylase/succinyl-diaminopimelate desuccinylase-like protein